MHSKQTHVAMTYRLLGHAAHGLTEIRAIYPDRRILIGCFDTETDFVRVCSSVNADGANVYAGIQPRPVDWFPRSLNVLHGSASGNPVHGASAADIRIINNQVIDIDPIRSIGTASTREELQSAFEEAGRAVALVRAQGYRPPVVAMSGNGFQLWFAHPAEEASGSSQTEMIALEKLIRDQADGSKVKIDSMADLSRIIRVIGTVNRKGDGLGDRPHRVSCFAAEVQRHEDLRLVQLRRKLLGAAQPAPTATPPRDAGLAAIPDHLPAIKITRPQLAELLARLPIADYQDYDPWFAILCAAHHATDGTGFPEFDSWSDGDPDFAGKTSERAAKWQTVARTTGPQLGYRTLAHAVAEYNLPTEEGTGAARKPTIEIQTDLQLAVNAALPHLSAGGLYQRDGQLVRPLEVDRLSWTSEESSGLTIRAVSVSTLRGILSHIINWTRWRASKTGGELTETTLSRDLAEMVAHWGEYSGTPVLQGISTTPFLRPDGTVCTTPGYDTHTGYVYRAGHTFPTINDTPSQAEAHTALQELTDLFCDFPFATPADKMVAVAALLTLFARPMVGNTPLFLVEASTSGSGKSLLTDIIATLATGRPAPKSTWPTGRGWQEELDKRLSAIALDAPPLACFDNITGRVGGAGLDKVATANGSVMFRVLGKTESKDLAWGTVLFLNGNNIVPLVSGDTRRRVLPLRLEPDTAHPERRTDFKRADILGHVEIQRPRLVCAALTILRAWTVAGQPVCCAETWGSFARWAHVIVNAIVYAGGSTPLHCKRVMDDEPDEEDATFGALVRAIHDIPELRNGATLAEIVDLASSPTKQDLSVTDGRYKNLFDAVAGCSGGPESKQLQWAFRRHRGRVFGQYQLRRIGTRHQAAIWSVVAKEAKNENS